MFLRNFSVFANSGCRCTQMERLSRLIFRWNIESLRLTWNISRKAMLYGRLNENKPQLCLKAAFAAWKCGLWLQTESSAVTRKLQHYVSVRVNLKNFNREWCLHKISFVRKYLICSLAFLLFRPTENWGQQFYGLGFYKSTRRHVLTSAEKIRCFSRIDSRLPDESMKSRRQHFNNSSSVINNF